MLCGYRFLPATAAQEPHSGRHSPAPPRRQLPAKRITIAASVSATMNAVRRSTIVLLLTAFMVALTLAAMVILFAGSWRRGGAGEWRPLCGSCAAVAGRNR